MDIKSSRELLSTGTEDTGIRAPLYVRAGGGGRRPDVCGVVAGTARLTLTRGTRALLYVRAGGAGRRPDVCGVVASTARLTFTCGGPPCAAPLGAASGSPGHRRAPASALAAASEGGGAVALERSRGGAPSAGLKPGARSQGAAGARSTGAASLPGRGWVVRRHAGCWIPLPRGPGGGCPAGGW